MADVLTQFSDDMAALVAASEPHVVRVEARRRVPASGVTWTQKGLIVTAHHVVEQDEDISVVGADGSRLSAELVGRDPSTDLAVLRVAESGAPAAEWADLDTVKVGHLVLAVGRPGRTLQATLGIVSALGDAWRSPMGGQIDRYLQTDVVMYPGFSGGPLLGADGRIIGINTSALVRGISLTLPTPTVARVVKDLLEHGHVSRGYLGVSAQAVQLPKEQAQAAGQETGLLLASVEAGGPAAEAGFLLGDTLLKLDDLPLRHLDDLLSALADRAGKKASLRTLRAGEVTDRQLTVGERP
jgi:S1-C subfamily serine protease